MTSPAVISAVRSIASSAVACRACFELGEVKAAQIAIAQPRWVGTKYWSSQPRIAVVLLNPGSGTFRADSADAQMFKLLKDFAAQGGSLRAIFSHQATDMPNWGAGKFTAFYFNGLGLSLNAVAFANIAWCATHGNKYPASMLNRCFERHTLPLLHALRPDVVLLSGSSAHGFRPAIERGLPQATVIPMLHYAHRSGVNVDIAEFGRVRGIIERVVQQTVQADGPASGGSAA